MTNRIACSRPAACPTVRRRRSPWRTALAAKLGPRAAAVVAVAAGLLGAEGDASAQEWLKDRRYQEGAGIRAGDLELHPGLGGEVGYDSNWLYRSQRDGYVNSGPIPTGLLRITPSLSLSTLTQKRLEDSGAAPSMPSPFAFRANLAATYREFLSGNDTIRDQRNVSANADVRLDINRMRPVGFGLFAGYQRLIRPQVLGDPNNSFNRSDVNAGGELVLMPGGGTLDMRLGYQFLAALFEESNGVPFTSYSHDITVRNRWRFRPRTALFQDTSLRFVNYPYADRSVFFLNDSTPLRTRLGLTGLVTDRFGFLGSVGYGATFFANTNNPATRQFDSLNAQVEGTFYLSTNPGSSSPGEGTLLLSTWALGYMRDFQNSFIGNYYNSNKGYTRLTYYFGGRVLAQLDGEFEALLFPESFDRGGTSLTGDFTNYRVGGRLFGEYRFSDSFGLNLTFDYQQMISDTVLAQGQGGGGGAPAGAGFDMNWQRFQALLGARWFL